MKQRQTTIVELETRIARLRKQDSDENGNIEPGSLAAFLIPKLEKRLLLLKKGKKATMVDTGINPKVHTENN